jgi:hypothetical protein
MGRWPRGFSGRRSKRAQARYLPQLGILEARALLSTITVTSDNDSGSGSLRAALASAVAGDTISFARSAYGTITLSSGPLEVTTNVTIDGPGPNKVTVDGNNTYQDLVVDANVTATISGLTFTGGNAPASYPYGGGGIFNAGTLTVDDCVVSGNSSAENGGGIDNNGSLTVSDTSVSNNTGLYGGGISNNPFANLNVSDSKISNNSVSADDGFGGGINNLATVTITGSVISNNSGQNGGGIFSGYLFGPSSVTITSSVVNANTSPSEGGGMQLQDSGATISDSTFANNVAGSTTAGLGVGGAIAAFGPDSLNITGSTFQGNAAIGSSQYGLSLGGAIYTTNFGLVPSGNLSVTKSAFVGNTVSGWLADGGAVHCDPGTNLTLNATSFNNNLAVGDNTAEGGAVDVDNSFGNEATITNDVFQSNEALISASTPYAGASAQGGALCVFGSTTVTSSTFTANQASGGPVGGLGLGGAIIDFSDSGLDVSISSFAGNSAVGGTGGGWGVGGGLNVFSGTASVSGTSFVANRALGGAAAGAGTQAGFGYGGAIENDGAVELNGCTLSANLAKGGAGTDGAAGGNGFGGGIESLGALTVADSSIAGNLALGGAGGGNGEGGAIYDTPAMFGIQAPLSVADSTITANEAVGGAGGGNGDGGGVYSSATASLTDTFVTFNSAIGGSGGGQGIGGGLYIAGSSMTLVGTTDIVLNFATTASDNIFGPYST